MVGKLTWYRATSSIICALMNCSKFFTKPDCLAKAIKEKNGELIDNYEQTAYQEMGDALEGVLIQTSAKPWQIKSIIGITNMIILSK